MRNQNLMIKSKEIQTVILIILFLIPLTVFARNANATPESDSTSVIVQDATHFVETGFGLLVAPFMFDRQDWARVALAAGGTALLFTVDKKVKDFALRNQNKPNDRLFYIDHFYGNFYSLILSSGIYGAGLLSGSSKIRKMGLHAAEAFLYSVTISGTVKVLLGRRRPYGGENQLFFKPFQIAKDKYKALPSTHTTVGFAVSTALAKSVDNIFWKIFWYGSAGLVGASRIYHNMHWLSDVFPGAVIGYYVGDFVVDFDKKEKPRIFGKRFQPWFGVNAVGLRVYLD